MPSGPPGKGVVRRTLQTRKASGPEGFTVYFCSGTWMCARVLSRGTDDNCGVDPAKGIVRRRLLRGAGPTRQCLGCPGGLVGHAKGGAPTSCVCRTRPPSPSSPRACGQRNQAACGSSHRVSDPGCKAPTRPGTVPHAPRPAISRGAVAGARSGPQGPGVPVPRTSEKRFPANRRGPRPSLPALGCCGPLGPRRETAPTLHDGRYRRTEPRPTRCSQPGRACLRPRAR